jgi:hypothetical protein
MTPETEITMKKIMTMAIGTVAVLTLAACSSDPVPTSTASPAGSEALPSPADEAATPATSTTPIAITIGDTTITATLNESRAAQDFIASLPVTVPSVRNNDIEYFGAVASPLSETGPFYDDVRPGDIVYYAPKDEVALIFEPTSSPGQLTKIGELTADLSNFDGLAEDADILYTLE